MVVLAGENGYLFFGKFGFTVPVSPEPALASCIEIFGLEELPGGLAGDGEGQVIGDTFWPVGWIIIDKLKDRFLLFPGESQGVYEGSPFFIP